jgi:acetylglutamate kinase
MENTSKKTILVKIGGSTLGQHDTTLADLVSLQKRGVILVVVHGGGKIISEWLAKLGASTQFVQGERVTDAVGLEVVTAVLSGLVNKDLVGSIVHMGGRAVGLSGVDGGLLQGVIKDPKLGYIGSLTKVDVLPIQTQIASGYIPVISSVSLNMAEKQPGGPLLLNVNADTAAGEIAAAMGAEKLIFLTDVAGICEKSGALISRLTTEEAEEVIISGVASGGMVPKIRAGIRALTTVGSVRIIDGRRSHALLEEIDRSEGGTTIFTGK